MNIETLTDEQKRVKIAEACGWKWLRRAEPLRNDLIRQESVGAYLKLGWVEIDQPKHEEFCDASTIPDYLNDLNAMHEAEEGLDCESSKRFADNLETIARIYQASLWKFMTVHATARQRADAFLLSLP